MTSSNYDENDLSASVSELSVDNSVSQNVSVSRLLKFGVDRILSDDILPDNSKNSPFGVSSPESITTNTDQFYQHQLNLYHKDEVNSSLSAPSDVTSTPPCSGCVTSLLRCCRLHVNDIQVAHYPTFYTARCSLLHTPKPIRPYTNLILESEIPDRNSCSANSNMNKRKRSWSRAVFSNLQRKGLEKRFQMQKYITKPDRRQLAATLGLTDAQVKVWFQNRRMKWRHNKELKYHNNNGFSSVGNLSSSVSSSSSSSSSNNHNSGLQKQEIIKTNTISSPDKTKCSTASSKK